MKKVSLQCVIVGIGSSFDVEVDDGVKVSKLMRAIKDRKPLTITCEADLLQLFLAKKGNAWLSSSTDDVKALKKGEKTGFIDELMHEKEKMEEEDPLSDYLANMNDPEVKQIHVLVVVPGILATIEVNENQAEDLKDELEYYQRLGQEIQTNCQQHCSPILDKIDQIYREGPHPKPFICVVGSSGMGKSQLAFALGGEGRERPRPWFYWPLAGSAEAGKQNVYKNFLSIARAFNSVVMQDLRDNEEDDILACELPGYEKKALWTYGFIIELLRYCSGANVGAQMVRIEEVTFKVSKSSHKAVVDMRTRMEDNGKVLPFFILDEMTQTAELPEMKRKAAFQRNVFRTCGLVVVVMGTDAKIMNLVNQSSDSRQDSHWWMTVVPCFPPYQYISFRVPAKDNAWTRAIQLDGVVELIAKNSRGLFSRYFVDAVVEFVLNPVTGNEALKLTDLLDSAFEAVSNKAQLAKGFMIKRDGTDSQLKAISYTHSTAVIPNLTILVDDGTSEHPLKKRKVSVENMQVHFANLEDEDITDVNVYWGRLFRRNTREEHWGPACHFPAIDKDVLLYLAVLGGKQSAYCNAMENEMEYSTVYAFEMLRTRVTRSHVNSNSLSINGDELENLVAHALFCASRRHGVGGIRFNNFFSALLGEFHRERFEPVQCDVITLFRQYDGLWRKFAVADSMKIPFLAPPNAIWPNFFSELAATAILVIFFALRTSRDWICT
ncbi:hypothetical protein DVH05_001005 [Phytophthora capsici]|nr:hypothetical protein DVH05_001005 [Phytophthora capsici]